MSLLITMESSQLLAETAFQTERVRVLAEALVEDPGAADVLMPELLTSVGMLDELVRVLGLHAERAGGSNVLELRR